MFNAGDKVKLTGVSWSREKDIEGSLINRVFEVEKNYVNEPVIFDSSMSIWTIFDDPDNPYYAEVIESTEYSSFISDNNNEVERVNNDIDEDVNKVEKDKLFTFEEYNLMRVLENIQNYLREDSIINHEYMIGYIKGVLDMQGFKTEDEDEE